ncbi:hypothetical protein COBT_001656 [Conglomerata obtusa]
MNNRSFGEGFSERLKKLCKKYEKIKDEEDDHIDLLKMNVIKDRGRTPTKKKVSMVASHKKKYKRITQMEVKRFDFSNTTQEFQRIYDTIFTEQCFDTLCKNVLGSNNNKKY